MIAALSQTMGILALDALRRPRASDHPGFITAGSMQRKSFLITRTGMGQVKDRVAYRMSFRYKSSRLCVFDRDVSALSKERMTMLRHNRNRGLGPVAGPAGR